MRRHITLPGALILLPLGFLAVFFFYPLALVIGRSFAAEGHFDLMPLLTIWSEAYFRRALWFTVWQATASTALTLALGLPAAFVFARYRFPGKQIVQALTTIPFVLPAMVVAAAFMAFLGPRTRVSLGVRVTLSSSKTGAGALLRTGAISRRMWGRIWIWYTPGMHVRRAERS